MDKDVEIVREHIDAFVAQDTERSASFLDERVVQDLSRIAMLDPSKYGVEGVVEGVHRYRGAFKDYDFAVNELTDLGSGQVLAEVSESGRGKGSGAPVQRTIAVLYTLIAGKIVRITSFPSADEARDAIGV